GSKGFVTEKLKELLDGGEKYDMVFAIGPVPMMRAVSKLTEQYGVKTVVSMNPIMIDGTGMCGGCRLTVGGQTKFACVDGPEFDGHKIDWDEAMKRLSQYRQEEHNCRLMRIGS
ncbi:MAG TPA: sulfide/dihydroorotate dehydrogenase-like FAD/NAD-binding protein, partial [Candidatus Avimonas sp.]|nr:sulfide/dihydroorotate dehydrogenase-like FAD/NAD-binding protein [Candidatus Avimonas sp.]